MDNVHPIFTTIQILEVNHSAIFALFQIEQLWICDTVQKSVTKVIDTLRLRGDKVRRIMAFSYFNLETRLYYDDEEEDEQDPGLAERHG